MFNNFFKRRIFYIRFRPKRFTIKDYIINTFLRTRFQIIRIFFSNKLNNSSPTIKNGLNLVFNDDFNDISWRNDANHQKWIVGEGWGLFHSTKPNVYYGEPELISNKSLAKFTVKYKPKEFNDPSTNKPIKIPFEVSLLSTEPFFKQQYGRFECRMTLPKGVGVWPAFWLWGSTWPPEIDVIEAYGEYNGLDTRYQNINIHFGNNGENRTDLGTCIVKIDNKKGVGVNFHEFVVEWSPKKIVFYTDGIKILQFTGKKLLNMWYNQPNAMTWIVINHSLRNGFISNDDSSFYSEFLVDYIRAYEIN